MSERQVARMTENRILTLSNLPASLAGGNDVIASNMNMEIEDSAAHQRADVSSFVGRCSVLACER